jgi:hypothetical protein
MSRAAALFAWFERTSDWLSPIVVKEVRQVVRGREFYYSFSISLVVGLAVAFFGAADAVTGTGTSGRGTFVALMACLTLLGLAIVPLGTFSALRNERLEQTLELITLTALSPRRVVIGKLLAQGVKLTTLFAGLAPFIAMSFLLGGIDFGSILISLALLFMWSLWACAACLFLSSLMRTRAMSGIVFGGLAFVIFMVFLAIGLPRIIFSLVGGAAVSSVGFSSGPDSWWFLAVMTTFCLATMGNLVLLAENRLALPSEQIVTPLRVGFFVQFLLILAWVLPAITGSELTRQNATFALGIFGGLHLALVAIFVVSEDLVVPRRLLVRMQSWSMWHRLFAMFRPGAGRGAVYVLAQMVLLLLVALLLRPKGDVLRWLLALCGYICVFTGIPAVAFRFKRPERVASFRVRVAILVTFSMSLVLPDILYYVLWQPTVLELRFAGRHLLNPIRTLANWDIVETYNSFAIPAMLGLSGVFAYLMLMHLGVAEPVAIDQHASVKTVGEPDRANVN